MSNGQKISQFTGVTTLNDSDLVTVVSNGQNFNITYADLKTSLGVSGSLSSVGAVLGVPILNNPSANEYEIRSLEDGAGVSAYVTASNGIGLRWTVDQDSTGVSLTENLTDITPDIASLVSGQGISITKNDNAITISNTVDPATGLANRVVVTQASDLAGTLDSTKEYFIDGSIDMGAQSIQVPASGLTISGYSFDLSGLYSSEATYDMFVSAPGGSGNLILQDLDVSVTGAGSRVYNLTDATGFNAIEILAVNFTDCTSLGTIDGYRQLLESGTGRFGGSPELTFDGSWVGGARIATSLTRSLGSITSLFKAGGTLTMAGRFITDMNCDLPASGAFIDFYPANITNDESLNIAGARITRNGTIDASDTTLHPNIDATSVKNSWQDNTGLPNTYKYLKGTITAEVATVVSAINTYYPLAGTFTLDANVHFDMPANGEFRLLTGNGSYSINGDLVIVGPTNDEVDVRVTKSTDGGTTWPTEVLHLKRTINSLSGGRDVAFFPLSFIATLKKDDRVRLEIENKTTTGNLTAELDSYFIVSQL
jgi:hypothetical protein